MVNEIVESMGISSTEFEAGYTKYLRNLDQSLMKKIFFTEGKDKLIMTILSSYFKSIDLFVSSKESLNRLNFLKSLTNFQKPQEWFPKTRRLKRKIIMNVGGTNSGKTHRTLNKLEKTTGNGIISIINMLCCYFFLFFLAYKVFIVVH